MEEKKPMVLSNRKFFCPFIGPKFCNFLFKPEPRSVDRALNGLYFAVQNTGGIMERSIATLKNRAINEKT